MLDKIGATLKTANEKLSEAHKSWRDESLADRERRLDEREAALTAREVELTNATRAFQARKARALLRRIGFGVGAAVLVFGAFVAGSMTAETPVSARHETDEGATLAAVTPESSEGPIANHTPEVRSMSYSECVERGDAYFKEIGSWPTLASTGESAHSAAVERCGRTTAAFGPW